jgi:LAS superfamily LD-carboxypeptidase LdcB
MKKVFVAIACMVIFSITGFAQRNNKRSPEEMAKQMTERMKTELKLAEEQVVPVDSINLVFAKAQAKLRENANGDFASIREDMQKLYALRLEAYEKVLTKEQLEAYKKIMEERMRNREGRRGDRPNN